MQNILKALDEKLKAQEDTILFKDYEIRELKRELAERDKIIAEQAEKIAGMATSMADRLVDEHGEF